MMRKFVVQNDAVPLTWDFLKRDLLTILRSNKIWYDEGFKEISMEL